MSIYKNGEWIKKDTLKHYIYIEGGVVIAKSIIEIKVPNSGKIEVSQDVYNEVVTKGLYDSGASQYYSKIMVGKEGYSVDDYEKVYNIDKIKADKCLEIDKKTDALIAQGCSFNGQKFSTSVESQGNWLAMYTVREVLAYPFAVSTLDDREYLISSKEEVEAFFLSGMQFINTCIASGRYFKVKVMNSTTKEEIDNIIDVR